MGKQATEWRQGACGDGRNWLQGQPIDSAGMNSDMPQIQPGGDLDQEGSLATVRFDQMGRSSCHEGQNEARKATA